MECEDGFLVPKDPQNVLLANFVIDKRIGKGQFSEVYRAQSEIDNCIVALKKVQVQKNLFKRGPAFPLNLIRHIQCRLQAYNR